MVGGGAERRSAQGWGSHLQRPITDTTMAIRPMVTDTIPILIRLHIMVVIIAPTTPRVTTRVVTISTDDFRGAR
jgi:hypothetical protein